MSVFNEISSRKDNYGGEEVHIRITRTELILTPNKDGSIDIRSNDNAIIANFSTDDFGGNKTLKVSNHDLLSIKVDG